VPGTGEDRCQAVTELRMYPVLPVVGW